MSRSSLASKGRWPLEGSPLEARTRGNESFQPRLTSRRVSRSLRPRAEQLNSRSQRIWLRLLPSHVLTRWQLQKGKKHPCESRQPRGSRLARRKILQADC